MTMCGSDGGLCVLYHEAMAFRVPVPGLMRFLALSRAFPLRPAPAQAYTSLTAHTGWAWDTKCLTGKKSPCDPTLKALMRITEPLQLSTGTPGPDSPIHNSDLL